MPKYVIQREYLLPVYQYLVIEADSFEEACGEAEAVGPQHDWDNAEEDYDGCLPTTITNAKVIPEGATTDHASHRRRRFLHSARRALRYGDGWMPNASRPTYSDVTEFLPQFRQMAAEAGRNAASVPITIFGAPEDLDRVKRYRDQRIARS
jgi:alkanesulfonate monooxygenase SsuD/methylene tetrahydromethanopterin reductase-like flavin-dependent oxidoreductase (luciferase family)